jgi:hypothetical protein
MVVKEKQNMTEQWIWCILCSCAGLCVWGSIRAVISTIEGDPSSVPLIYILFLSAVPALVLIYFYKNQLYTCYDQRGIKIQYFPFTRKSICWKEVNRMELIYLDIPSYTISRSEEYGMVYKAGGKTLIRVQTHSGQLMISTSKPEEIRKMMACYCPFNG